MARPAARELQQRLDHFPRVGLTKAAVAVVIRNVILESRSAYWTAVISRTTSMFAGSSFVPVWLSTTT
jgi:hypothetical protein